MTPLEKAEKAKQLLEDPIFRAVLQDIREAMVSQLEQSAMADQETHHQVALTLQVLGSIKSRLKRYADELTADKHRRESDSFMARIREKLTP